MPGMLEALETAVSEATAAAQEAPTVETQAEGHTPEVEATLEATATQAETPAETAARVRDEAGRFTKQEAKPAVTPEKATPAARPAGGVPAAKDGQQPATSAQGVAPRSWAAPVREHWEKLPREVKDTILKREGEASRAIAESGQARKAWQEFESVAAPYRALFTAPPVQVAANLFQTAAALQTGDIPTKAGLVAQMIRNFGIPPDAVADALEGKAPTQQAQSQAQQFRDPRVDDLLRRQQEDEQRAMATQRTEAQRALQEFESQAEFIEDVREDMAILLETGRARTYEEAYRKACAMNDEVGKVLAERKATAAREQSQQAQKARQAAGSVKSDPAPPTGGRKPTWEEALAANLAGGRR